MLPQDMSPVTGGARSWAFYLADLQVVDVEVDVAAYVAPYATKGETPLPIYLRWAHGRACAARREQGGASNLRRIAVVGETVAPHAVFLARET